MVYTNSSRPTDQVTVTITFSGNYSLGVSDVSFTIFDIDKNSYHDRISNISATGIDGTTQYAPTITNVGSAVNLTGNGLNQTLSGAPIRRILAPGLAPATPRSTSANGSSAA